MAKLVERGYAQLEPNRIASQFSKSIISQYPLTDEIEVLENGQVVSVEVTENGPVVVAPQEGLPLFLHYSEIYVPEGAGDWEFAVMHKPETFVQEAMVAYPRLFPLTTGDTFTTNAVDITKVEWEAVQPGDAFGINEDGNWAKDAELCPVKVVKATDMPDGQMAVKFIVE